MSEAEQISAHGDTELFREALRFTAAQTGFTARLIEKDYFCTVLLNYLARLESAELVFKGGTCLAKIHFELYRLSEDLDFMIPVAVDCGRSARRTRIDPVYLALRNLPKNLPVFRVTDDLKGANNSRQYLAAIAYTSILDSRDEMIKVEVSLREPLLMSALNGSARTLLMNPLTSDVMVKPIRASCIAKEEALAEKFRAALSRRDPAIRDFYDIDHAVRKHNLNPSNSELIERVKQKLAVPSNNPIDVSAGRLTALFKQLDPQLRPVLRAAEFGEFDLERGFRIVAEMAKTIA